MSHVSEGQRSFAPPLPEETRRVIRWLCTNNPFYAISAGLFLAGLWVSIGDPRQAETTWGIMAALVGYTLLLAVTAYLLVRFANLWDDARTVLLLVVLMFLATSVMFDEVLVVGVVDNQPVQGVVCYLVGLLFAIAVSEGLLCGIRLGLPAWYRGPYYLILFLFFLYPLALSSLLNLKEKHSEATMWALFGFASVAGLVFLTLLPAIRRGAAYVRGNGSPWPWPLYPWSLFGILALAVPGRAFLLCYSMHLVNIGNLSGTIFGLYFLVPFGLAIAVLVLEMGLVTGRAGVLWFALALPVGLLLMSMMGHRADSVYQDFLNRFTRRLGCSPAYLTLLAAAGFYAYAAVRVVPYALEALTAALLALALSGSNAMQVAGFVLFQQVPLLAVAVVQLGLGAWQHSSWRCLLGSFAGIASLTIPGDAAGAALRWMIAAQLVMLALLIVGALFDDDFARRLRGAGGGIALLTGVVAVFGSFEPPPALASWTVDVYPLVLALLLIGYGWLLQHRLSFAIAGLLLACWVIACGWQGYCVCRRFFAGLDYIAISLVLFVLAILVSLGKSGILSRWLGVWRSEAPKATE